jgi:hypothetical protein
MEKAKVRNELISLLIFVVLAPAVPPVSHAATFEVKDTEDLADIRPGDSVCSTAAGTCTLRAAIQESNALGAPAKDQIKLTPGVYELKMGALEILDSLVITGDSADSTIIDGDVRFGIVFSIGGVGRSPIVTISGVTIQKGSSNVGAGIYIYEGSTLFLTSSIVKDNKADSGGGIYNLGALDVSESTITRNEASLTGGGGIVNRGTATLNRSIVANNSAEGGGARGGGGIENIQGQVSITNSTISGNKVTGGGNSTGGGIRNAQGGTVKLVNVTIFNNSAVASSGNLRTGGGISNGANSTVNVINTIIAGNSAANGGPDCYGTLTSGDFNLISNTADCVIPGTNNTINQSAQLEPLAFNGGPTSIHALSATSPAIDKGNNIGCPPTDQRGVPRPLHGHCDIGAFEHGGYYVGKHGSDANTCGQAQSYSTPRFSIASGASCLNPGDTLFVQAGIYAEELSNVIPPGTSQSATVTVTAFPAHVVAIRPTIGASGALNFLGPAQAHIVVDGISVDCVNASIECVSIRAGAHHVKIKNTEVKNSPGVGVFSGSDIELSELNVHSNKGDGVHFNGPSNVMHRSLIHNNGGTGIGVTFNGTSTQIYNNTINKNSGYGIDVGANVSGTVIRNNIISSNSNGGINDAGAGTIRTNNLIN